MENKNKKRIVRLDPVHVAESAIRASLNKVVDDWGSDARIETSIALERDEHTGSMNNVETITLIVKLPDFVKENKLCELREEREK